MAIIITGIEKQGPVIICTTNDPKERVYKLDFKERTAYGITGKPLQSTGAILSRIPASIPGSNPLCIALRVFSDGTSYTPTFYGVVESLLSYPDLLPYNIDSTLVYTLAGEHNGKLPKGWVVWCREGRYKFSMGALREFLAQQELAKWPQGLADTVRKFSEGAEFDLAKEANYDKELCASLMRIIGNSMKRYEIRDLLSNVRSIIQFLRLHPQLRSYLDETKNARTAYQILDNALNQERNSQILANEARIAALNGMEINGLLIKVPSKMEDFTDEGNQQHNCVGYYYHDRMAKGMQLIYFLRHVANPDKSYVTCRFDMSKLETVEHRTQHNDWYENGLLFERIDTMIKTQLGM